MAQTRGMGLIKKLRLLRHFKKLIRDAMYFDYFPINASTSTSTAITALQLATYIATEWRPSIPTSFINSFVDVIHVALEPRSINGSQYWCANSDLANTDRQWSGVTSWMMGIAFTRFIIEEEGYPWWSPVSAFKGSSSVGKTMTGNWPFILPRSHFTINKPSGLLPDYLVLKLNRHGTIEFAFVESKGTNRSIASWRVAPTNWVEQSRAKLYYGTTEMKVARNIVIATRVNPIGKRLVTRKVVVRAWNENNRAENTNAIILAYFLASHYSSICFRLGYTRFADLMTLIGARIINDSEAERQQVNAQIASGFNRELEILRNPDDFRTTLNVRVGPYIIDETNSPINLIFGERIFTARFTRSAFLIMRDIVFSNPNQLISNILTTLNGIEDLRRLLRNQSSDSLAVTLNGIAVFDQSLLS